MNTTEEGKLTVTVRGTDELPVIELAGQIIDSDVKKFQKHIEQIHKTTCRTIYLDVSKPTYIDSHVLGHREYFHTLMQKEERELIIVNGNDDKSPYLCRMFDQTNLDKVLTIVNKI